MKCRYYLIQETAHMGNSVQGSNQPFNITATEMSGVSYLHVDTEGDMQPKVQCPACKHLSLVQSAKQKLTTAEYAALMDSDAKEEAPKLKSNPSYGSQVDYK